MNERTKLKKEIYYLSLLVRNLLIQVRLFDSNYDLPSDGDYVEEVDNVANVS